MGRQSFAGFKKVSSTDTHTTFAHPNGSQLTIPHKALDKNTLKKMSGIRKYSGEEGDPQEQIVSLPNYKADPVQVAPDWTPEQNQKAHEQEIQGSVNALYDPIVDAGRLFFKGPEAMEKGQAEREQTRAGIQQPETNTEPLPTNVNMGNPQQQAPNPYAQLAAGQTPGFKYDPYQGINTQIAGANQEANVIGRIEDQKAQLIQEHQKAQENLNYQVQQNAWNNKVETDNWIDDMKNGHIDPKAYVNNMSTGQKTATAIGLILGGMAEGLLHNGKNPALEMLNKNIDNDIKAQLENRENKKTIFNALQKQYGNQQDALTMLRAFYTQKLVNDLGEAAARNGSDLAKARAAQVVGPLQNQLQQMHFDVGMRQAALQNMGSGNVANMAAAIPYLVRDKTKVSEAAKAYGEAMQLNHQQDNLVKSFNDIRSKFRNGLLSPNDTQSAKQAFIGNLQVALEHRYNSDAAAALGNAIFPRATDTDSTVDNKFKRLLQEAEGARSEKDATLRALTGGLLGAPKPAPIFNKRK